MAITTYGGLKTSIAAWLKRSDMDAIIPDFITLAEARIARDLRLRKQITSATLPTVGGNQAVTLPADFLEAENVSLLTDPKTQLVYVNIEHLDSQYPTGLRTGSPAVYTLEGDNILLGPTPDGVYQVDLLYYGKFAALSASTDTNWLLTNHPSIYLFAALAEAHPYTMDDGRVALWEQKYAKDVKALQDADDQSMFSGTSLRVRQIS